MEGFTMESVVLVKYRDLNMKVVKAELLELGESSSKVRRLSNDEILTVPNDWFLDLGLIKDDFYNNDITVQYQGDDIMVSYHAEERVKERFGVRHPKMFIKKVFKSRNKELPSTMRPVHEILKHGGLSKYVNFPSYNLVAVIDPDRKILLTIYEYFGSKHDGRIK